MDIVKGAYYIDRPFGMENFEERPCPTPLPYWTPTGWRLVALVPPPRQSGADPYALYDRWDNLLHVWDQEYPPSYVEVVKVCEKVMK